MFGIGKYRQRKRDEGEMLLLCDVNQKQGVDNKALNCTIAAACHFAFSIARSLVNQLRGFQIRLKLDKTIHTRVSVETLYLVLLLLQYRIPRAQLDAARALTEVESDFHSLLFISMASMHHVSDRLGFDGSTLKSYYESTFNSRPYQLSADEQDLFWGDIYWPLYDPILECIDLKGNFLATSVVEMSLKHSIIALAELIPTFEE